MSEWTCRDLDILRLEYPRRKTEEVAKMLNRSARAVSVKACKLGIKKDHYGIVWTPQMLKLLTDFFPAMFDTPLAKWIGVSKRTLIRKARELGLEKKPGFLEDRREDIKDLARIALKRRTDISTRFQKGVRYNPAGEFKKGRKESEESKAKRVASLKLAWKRRKEREELKSYGIGLVCSKSQ